METSNRPDPVMMKCGHAANAEQGGKPVCVLCLGIKSGADEVSDEQINFADRTAKCMYCKTVVPSNPRLPFFWLLSNSKSKQDSYYCGCRGWD